MEVLAASWVPQSAPFLAVITFVGGSSPTAIGIGLVAEGTIVAEFTRAVLPADGADTIEVITAEGVAKKAILLLVRRA